MTIPSNVKVLKSCAKCGLEKSILPGKATCSTCVTANKRKRRVALGLCTECGITKVVAGEPLRCKACRLKESRNERARLELGNAEFQALSDEPRPLSAERVRLYLTREEALASIPEIHVTAKSGRSPYVALMSPKFGDAEPARGKRKRLGAIVTLGGDVDAHGHMC